VSFEELLPYLEGARLSFSVQLPASSTAGQSDLLVVDLPPYMSRPWTLNLLGFRYAFGPIIGFGAQLAGQATIATADVTTSGAGAVKVLLTWGVDGSVERAVMDYPPHGGSLQMTAGSIRVGVAIEGFVGSTGSTPPLVGGFIAPSPHSSATAANGVTPQYTYGSQAIGSAQNKILTIPKRACAYRIYYTDVGFTTSDIDLAQLDQTGTIMQWDGLAPPASPAASVQWIPLNAQAQYVRLTNNAAGGRIVSAIFLLDLG